MSDLVHFCIVRADLSIGVMCAQLIHASGESSTGDLEPGTIAVGLEARDEEHLLLIEEQLIFYQIPHVAIREPDEPWCGDIMAIGIVPCSRKTPKKVVGKPPLIGKGK